MENWPLFSKKVLSKFLLLSLSKGFCRWSCKRVNLYFVFHYLLIFCSGFLSCDVGGFSVELTVIFSFFFFFSSFSIHPFFLPSLLLLLLLLLLLPLLGLSIQCNLSNSPSFLSFFHILISSQKSNFLLVILNFIFPHFLSLLPAISIESSSSWNPRINGDRQRQSLREHLPRQG